MKEIILFVFLFMLEPIVEEVHCQNVVNVWVADDSIKVLLQNQSPSNLPTIPMLPGISLPENFTSFNDVWNSSARSVILQGSRGETLAFQLFLSPEDTESIYDMDVEISALNGPGNSISPILFREWYIWIPNNSPTKAVALNVSGYYPDALIPFIDPYGSGQNIGTPFNITVNQTQGIWVDVNIPTTQSIGTYQGSISLLGNDGSLLAPIISLSVVVWAGTLPGFNSDPSMLKGWIPLYETRFFIGEGTFCSNGGYSCDAVVSLVEKYQIMAHEYCFDTQLDQVQPYWTLNATTNELTIDWTDYDILSSAALNGSLFGDGTTLEVINSPITEDWGQGMYDWWYYLNSTLPPPELMEVLQSYSAQISQHFTLNNWHPNEILGYVFDEPYGKLDESPNIYGDIGAYATAINNANIAVEWNNPVRFFLTSSPSCMPGAFPEEIGNACLQQQNLSYPSDNSPSWVIDWSPNSAIYVPGPLNYTTPDYSIDGVKANSEAPVPLKSWFYQNHAPFVGGAWINDEAIGFRTWAWIAFKYRVNGLFLWAANFWASDSGSDSTPSNFSTSPYLVTSSAGDGIMFYPGAELNSTGVPSIVGPVPSIRMSMWRRGYQDYLYMWALQKNGYSSYTQSIVDSIIGVALNWENVDPYWYIAGWAEPGNWSHNPMDYNRARIQMMQLLASSSSSLDSTTTASVNGSDERFQCASITFLLVFSCLFSILFQS